MSSTLTVKRGDTLQGAIRFQDSNGDPVDLTGCTARMQIRNHRTDAEIIAPTVTIGGGSIYSDAGVETVVAEGDGTYGAAFYLADAEAMAAVAPGSYVADIELTFPDETVVSSETFAVQIIKDVTL